MCLAIPLTWFEINDGFSKATSNYKIIYRIVYKIDADVKNILNKLTFSRQQDRFGLVFPMLLKTNGATHHNIIKELLPAYIHW